MAVKKKSAKKAVRRVARKKAAKRELIDTGTNKLFVRRNAAAPPSGKSRMSVSR